MKQRFRRLIPTIILGLMVITVYAMLPNQVALAGEPPGGVIGPRNPTMYTCREGDGFQEVTVPDPFIKETRFEFLRGGRLIAFNELDDEGKPYFENGPALLDPAFRDKNFVRIFGSNESEDFDDRIEHYDPQLATCDNSLFVDFGFNHKDAVLYESYLQDLDRACEDAGGTLKPIEETRVEGFVYEFHQRGDGEWLGVPSRSVPVHLNGITFDLEWGTNDEGYYYFTNLGAGPMVLNLRLPPDAHPINPNVILFSSGLDSGLPEGFPPLTVIMGFYRGPVGPSDVAALRTPAGQALPFSSQSDIDSLRQCGYLGTPAGGNIPPEILDMSLGLPYVGGEPEPTNSMPLALVAVGVFMLLIVGGSLKLFYHRAV